MVAGLGSGEGTALAIAAGLYAKRNIAGEKTRG